MNAINNHHSLWNTEQADSYIATAKATDMEAFIMIFEKLSSMGMATAQNFIQEFKAYYPKQDETIMEATGLAYVGI